MTISPVQNNLKHLYEEDYFLWIQQTLQHLQVKDFNQVDWEHLLEEIDSLGKQQQQELENRLLVLFEHLLKFGYWHQERKYNQRGWKGSIREQRKQIKRLLHKNPSLNPYFLEVMEGCYQDARDITLDKTGLPESDIPVSCSIQVEQVLDETWFPKT